MGPPIILCSFSSSTRFLPSFCFCLSTCAASLSANCALRSSSSRSRAARARARSFCASSDSLLASTRPTCTTSRSILSRQARKSLAMRSSGPALTTPFTALNTMRHLSAPSPRSRFARLCRDGKALTAVPALAVFEDPANRGAERQEVRVDLDKKLGDRQRALEPSITTRR